jgi:Tfp pilus assembly protein PilF
MLCRGVRGTLGAAGLLALTLCLAGCEQVSLNRKPGRAKEPAAESFKAVNLKVTPDQSAEVKLALAQSLESQGQVAPAIDYYKQVLEMSPKRIDVVGRLAVLYDRRGQFDASAPLYDKVLKSKPNDANVLCDRGYSLYLQGKYAESEDYLRKALAAQPELTRAHNNLGLVLGRTGRATDAIGEFTKAGCAAADAHQNLAFAFTLERRFAEAKAQYQLALSANPGSTVAKSGLQNLETLAKNELPPLPIPRDGNLLRASAAPRAN